jgi:hypothetical protein
MFVGVWWREGREGSMLSERGDMFLCCVVLRADLRLLM